MPDETPPSYDCQTCGCCCASPSPGASYVKLDDADIDRLRGTGLPILEFPVQDADPPQMERALPTKNDPHGTKVCVALNGCAGGANSCSVYELRPGACRTFEVGGLCCRLARERFGLPV